MAHLLDQYVGWEVQVRYLLDGSGYVDQGQLVAHSDGWIEIVKKAGERLLIPSTAIRIVKLIVAPDTDSMRLLRPADRSDETAPEP